MIRYSQSHKVGITAMTLLLGFPCYSKVYLFLSLCLLSRIIPMGFTVQLFQRGDLRGFFSDIETCISPMTLSGLQPLI